MKEKLNSEQEFNFTATLLDLTFFALDNPIEARSVLAIFPDSETLTFWFSYFRRKYEDGIKETLFSQHTIRLDSTSTLRFVHTKGDFIDRVRGMLFDKVILALPYGYPNEVYDFLNSSGINIAKYQ